jgi:hypothetical protein
MPYDETIEARILTIVSRWKNTDAKKMFGGVCHLLNGNMFSGVYKDYLILRLGDKGAAEAMKSKYAHPFDITGRPMRGWVMIEKGGFKRDEELEAFLEEARGFVKTLPKKDS